MEDKHKHLRMKRWRQARAQIIFKQIESSLNNNSFPWLEDELLETEIKISLISLVQRWMSFIQFKMNRNCSAIVTQKTILRHTGSFVWIYCLVSTEEWNYCGVKCSCVLKLSLNESVRLNKKNWEINDPLPSSSSILDEHEEKSREINLHYMPPRLINSHVLGQKLWWNFWLLSKSVGMSSQG